MNSIDVTNQMDFQNPDDELLPVTRCACGVVFRPWEFTISIYQNDPHPCPKCGRQFYFKQTIHVYEVME